MLKVCNMCFFCFSLGVVGSVSEFNLFCAFCLEFGAVRLLPLCSGVVARSVFTWKSFWSANAL